MRLSKSLLKDFAAQAQKHEVINYSVVTFVVSLCFCVFVAELNLLG